MSEVILIVVADTARVRRLSELELQHIWVRREAGGPPSLHLSSHTFKQDIYVAMLRERFSTSVVRPAILLERKK